MPLVTDLPYSGKKFGEPAFRTYWRDFNLATTDTDRIRITQYRNVWRFLIGDYTQTRQFATLKTSPNFPALRYFLKLELDVHVLTMYSVHFILIISSEGPGGISAKVCINENFLLYVY